MNELILAIIGIIAAGIAAGIVTAYVIIMTFNWIKDKIKKWLDEKNAKKVAVGDLEALIKEAVKNSNQTKLDDIDKMVKEGYGYFMAAIDDEDQILGEVEIIKDENETLDAEVKKLLGKEGLVVVEE